MRTTTPETQYLQRRNSSKSLWSEWKLVEFSSLRSMGIELKCKLGGTCFYFPRLDKTYET